ncbi:MAG: hypothetical protein GY821_14510 [Gammaproteobacteria bacterium]|nr:hypothetical protein [Gammaproteobacteria bacterium]
MRNIAVALGNAPYAANIVSALQRRQRDATPLLDEHLCWALKRQQQFKTGEATPPQPYKLEQIPAKRWHYLEN